MKTNNESTFLNQATKEQEDPKLTFKEWLRLMPASTFPDREEWQVNDMAFRLEEIIIYAKNYLLTTTYPNGPAKGMLDKGMEEYK